MGIGTPRSHNRIHPTRPELALSFGLEFIVTTSVPPGQEACLWRAPAGALAAVRAAAIPTKDRGSFATRPTARSVFLRRLGLDRALALEAAREIGRAHV